MAKILLDTHAFLWWMTDSPRLSSAASAALEDRENHLLLSAAVAWELATKVRIGRLSEAEVILNDLEGTVSTLGLVPLPVSLAHARLAGSIVNPHRDPFDRVLVAQSLLEDATLVSADRALASFNVSVIW